VTPVGDNAEAALLRVGEAIQVKYLGVYNVLPR